VDVRILRQGEIRELLSFAEAIAAVKKSFADYSSGRAVVAGIINLDLEEREAEIHVKSAYLRGSASYVIKIASGFYRNPSLELPVGNGMLLLFSAETGLLQGLLFDDGFITEMRTAAAGAVAAGLLAKKELPKVALIGSGSQARYQLKALLEVRAPGEIRVWSRNAAGVRAYIEEMAPLLPEVRFMAAQSCEEAVRGSDLVITVTPSRTALVKAEWLGPGVHITAVGSDGPEKQELDPEILKRADLVYCDSIVQCASLGEVHHALEANAIEKDKISGELGDIILGRKAGRENDRQISVADLTGLGVQDAAAATLVYEKAVRRNLGQFIGI
jgi:ornithine cyclodeaminase